MTVNSRDKVPAHQGRLWAGSLALARRGINTLTAPRQVPRPFVPSLTDRVAGRTVMITGASAGIGRHLAIRIADAGATAVVTARRTDELDNLVREIKARGGKAAAIPGDLSTDDGVNAVADAVLADHGTPDILVLNAGRSIMRSVVESELRLHDYERTMRINYLGGIGLVLRFLPGMRERRSGHVIHSSSVGVLANLPRFSAYIGSKAALDAVLRVAAVENAGHGLKFTNVHLPLVETEMIDGANWTGFARLSADDAVGMLVDAIRRRPRQVNNPFGNVAILGYTAAPGPMNRIQNYFHHRMEDIVKK